MSSEENNDNFNRLSLGATVQKTFEIYSRGFKILTSLSAMTVIVSGLIWSILLLFLKPAFEIDAEKLSDPSYLLAHIGGFYAMLGIYLLVCMLVSAFMTGPMIRAIVDLYMGKQPILKQCLKVGLMRAPTLICANTLATILVLIGYIFLVAPGFYVGVRWFFVPPIIVVEGLGVFASLKRSWNLVAGSWCYVFCTVLFCQIILLVVAFLWNQVLLGLDSVSVLFSVYSSLASLIPAIVSTPIFSIVMTLMYINMRIEKEGLNQSELIRNMGDSGAMEDAYTPLVDDEHVDESPLLDPEANVDI